LLNAGLSGVSPGTVTVQVTSLSNPTLTTTTTATVTALSPTTTTLASDHPTGSVYGQGVSFTATVTAAAGGTPTGSVDFTDTTTGKDLGTAPLQMVQGVEQATIAVAEVAAGTHAITAVYTSDNSGVFASSSSSSLNQVVAPATLTVTASDASKVYGQANPAFTDTITGYVNGDGAGVVTGDASLTTTATAGSGVGNYPISPSQGTLSAANYTFAFQSGTLTVSPASLTVTAQDASKIYGASLPTFTDVITGFINGDGAGVVSGAASLTTTSTAGSGVGTYPISPSQGSLSAANYTFAFANGTLTVTPATLTVTANNASKVYGEANPVFTDTISGFVNGDSASAVTGAASLTTSATASSPVGTYPITPSQGSLSAANYTFAFANGALTVTPATLTVTANDASKIAGFPLPAFTDTMTGFVNGDNASVVSGAAGLTTSATAASPAGAYPILVSPGTLNAANYTFAFQSGTLTVTPAPLVVLLPPVQVIRSGKRGIPTALVLTFNGPLNAAVASTPTHYKVYTRDQQKHVRKRQLLVNVLGARYDASRFQVTLTIGKAKNRKTLGTLEILGLTDLLGRPGGNTDVSVNLQSKPRKH
jgi:hypothetical protein